MMNMRSSAAMLTCAMAGFLSYSKVQAEVELISFESGVPAGFRAIKGKLAVMGEKVQDGNQALRWDFQAGDMLEMESGPLGDTAVSTGYGGYSRSAIVMPLYNPESRDGKLVLEWLAGGEVVGDVEIPLIYQGWQKLVYHYSWNSAIRWQKQEMKGKIDRLRIRVMDVSKGGYIILDAVHFNTPKDFRDGRKAVTENWHSLVPDFSKEPAPTKSDLQKLAVLEQRLRPALNPSVKAEVWQKKIENYQKEIETLGCAPGKGITKNLGTYFSVLNRIAEDACACADPQARAGLVQCYHQMHDWMQDLGLVVDGATGVANNYIGREYVDATSKMRDDLEAHGTLQKSIEFIKWSYAYDQRMYQGEGRGESMDYFHNEGLRLLRIALMHGNANDRWQHANRFRKVLSEQLVASVKPDGSLYHHGFHYFAYGTMGMNSISGALAHLSAADLPVTERALDAVRLGVMPMRWYAGGGNVLLSLCGRHPSGTQMVNPSTFLNLANAYAPYRNGRPDTVLMAAYLRMQGKSSDAEVPELAPNGHVSMPYAGLGLHRREHWLAGVKGYGKDLSAGESYADANRFGLYLSNGFLELQTHPAPMPTVHGSGTRPDDGWNWCAPDGSTTIHAPLSVIANGNGTRSEYGSDPYVGGLAHWQRQGIFAMKLNSAMQASICREKGVNGKPLQAQKSWFFFDQDIICVGSNISVDQVNHPVRTTLFQKFLCPEHLSAKVNQEVIPLNEKQVVTRTTKGRAVLVDPYGNAYLSEDPVVLTVGKQESRDGYDKKDTSGNYATAWVDHGKNPDGASYAYAVRIQPTAEQLEELTKSTPYQLLKRDQTAHVVLHHATKAYGYAIFSDRVELNELSTPVVSVESPSLVMVEPQGNRIQMSVTIPAVRASQSGCSVVSVVLRGKYRAMADLPSAVTVTNDPLGTRVTASVAHGESLSLSLQEQNAHATTK